MDSVTKEAFLQRYAFLAVHVGVGLEPGQRLVIRSPLDAAPLVRHLAVAAYQAGAPYVNVVWSDVEVAKARFLNAPEDSFEEIPYGQAAALEGMALRGDAFIAITAEDPEALKDADPARVSRARAALSTSLKPWRKLQMSDAVPWSVIAAPSPGWARKVFPGVSDEEAVDALWNAIFEAIRLDDEDPVTAWQCTWTRSNRGRRS
jgi:Leucyl aminopeptidase (aminopeptidase T)